MLGLWGLVGFMFYVDSYECVATSVWLLGGLVICNGFGALGTVGVSLVTGIVDFLGVVFVQVGLGVGCVVLCCVSLDFIEFFILFGLWCRLRCS